MDAEVAREVQELFGQIEYGFGDAGISVDCCAPSSPILKVLGPGICAALLIAQSACRVTNS